MKGLLDENLTPRAALELNAAGHDFWHVRDRGLIGRSDRIIWQRALAEDRTLFTVNHGDFVALAARTELHPGLVLVPPDLLITEQCAMLGAFVDKAEGLDLVGKTVELGIDSKFTIKS